jgi:aryl-alcohol dehydrogenase-like predicted oxidoreductase
MTTLTMELPPEAYRQLHEEANRLGKSPQDVASEWLIERLTASASVSAGDREKARQVLRAAGLLAELSPNLQRLANPKVHLDDIKAALGRSGGKTLSEIVLEQRGPRA